VKLTLEIIALESSTALNWRKVSSNAGTYEDNVPLVSLKRAEKFYN